MAEGTAQQRVSIGETKDGKLPVTLLSGFLGAGKTTLLKRILENTQGMRVAVIVNDMAELNIDGALVAGSKLVQKKEALVQLQNGCICCTLRGDLLQEVAALAAAGSFDYLVVESTGISEPMQVAETFAMTLDATMQKELASRGLELPRHAAAATNGGAAPEAADGTAPKRGKKGGGGTSAGPGASGREQESSDLADAEVVIADEGEEGGVLSLSDFARLDTCVTVVDAASFFDDLQSIEELADRYGREAVPDGDDRSLAQLLVEQVEFADTIILNKADIILTMAQEDRDRLRRVLRQLNPAAKVLEATRCAVDLCEVVATGRFDMDKAAAAPGWMASLRGEVHTPETEEYGIGSFVYRARRPFHPGRLYRNFLKKYFLTRVTLDVPAGDDSSDNEDEESGSGTDEESGSGSDDGSSSGDDGDQEGLEDYEEKRRSCVAAIRRDLGGLVRSKGFFWVATQHDTMLEWSHAGVLLAVGALGQWFAALPEDMWPEEEEARARIRADFDASAPPGSVGDRRQEVVFIGQALDRAAITRALDACLCTDEEVAAAGEGRLGDPLFGDDDEDEDGRAEEGAE